MNGQVERELMRLLHGELPAPEAEKLRARLAREPELQAAYRRLAGAWESLGEPPAAVSGPAFRVEVMERLRRERGEGSPLAWRAAPAWARLAAVLALGAGLALGSSLAATVARDGGEEGAAWSEEPTLAESYAAALAEDGAGDPWP